MDHKSPYPQTNGPAQCSGLPPLFLASPIQRLLVQRRTVFSIGFGYETALTAA
jgi:hypothetical protein